MQRNVRFAGRAWLVCALFGAAVLAYGSGMQPAAAQQVAAASGGTARLWFYRDYEPYESLNDATVMLNGVPAAIVPFDGRAQYRDIPAGHYRVTVGSYMPDPSQAKDIDLMPGSEVFVKIQSLRSWQSTGDFSSFERDTFYVALIPPQVARGELASRRSSGG